MKFKIGDQFTIGTDFHKIKQTGLPDHTVFTIEGSAKKDGYDWWATPDIEDWGCRVFDFWEDEMIPYIKLTPETDKAFRGIINDI